MTVSTTASSTVDLGNGVVTAFSWSFLIPNAAAAVLTYTDASGTATALTPSQYTINGLGVTTGGTVTYPLSGSPISSGATLTIGRILPFVQGTSISAQGATFAAIESALDNEMMLLQQINGVFLRSVRAPDSDPVMTTLPARAARANQGMAFDANGNPIAGTLTTIPVSSAMTPVFQASTITAAIQALKLTLHGQCRFQRTSSTIATLAPYGGGWIVVNGVPYQIGAGGITASNSGLSVSTSYYYYAYTASSALALTASTTAHTSSVTVGNIGIETMIGSDLYTLVGFAFTDGSGFFQDNVTDRTFASWFNKQMKPIKGTVTAQNVTTAAYVEITTSARVRVLTFTGDGVIMNQSGYAQMSVSGNYLLSRIGRNGTTSVVDAALTSNYIGTNATQANMALAGSDSPSEGLNYYTPLGSVTGAQGTYQVALSGFVFS